MNYPCLAPRSPLPSRFAVSVRTAAATILIGGLPFLAQAQTTWNAGGTPDLSWSNFDNWSSVASPAGQDVFFPDANKTTVDVPNNIVDADFTIRSLTFTNTGFGESDWHVTQIDSGVTLTINDVSTPATSLLVGGMAGGSGEQLTTLARIEGSGSLFVNQAAGDIRIGNTGINNGQSQHRGYATLDLSGLSNFDAVVNRFEVGVGRTSNGTVLLAADSEITATMLVVGDSAGNHVGGHGHMRLGEETRLLVNDIRIGARSASPSASSVHNFASGTVDFQEGLDTPTLLIRGSAGGDSRAGVWVGDQGGDVVANTAVQEAVLDLTGGEVDAKIGLLLIGRGRGNSTSAGLNTSVSMDAGVMDVEEVRVGTLSNNANAAAGAAVGTLNLQGGTFLANDLLVAYNISASARQTLQGRVNIEGSAYAEVTNTIVLGTQTTTSTPGTISAVLDISGGELLAKGGIAEGANPGLVSSELILRGGTLDVNGQSISVDDFKLESGVLRNLSQFNSGADVVKTTTGTLIVEGINAYTGATLVEEGTLLVDGNLTGTSGVTVFDGAAIGGGGFIAGDLFLAAGAEFVFNFTETLTVGGTMSFGGFGVDDLSGLDSTADDGTYSLVSGIVNFDNVANVGLENAYALGGEKWAYFQEGSLELVVVTIANIPEPATGVFLAAFGVMMMALVRRPGAKK